MIVQIRDARPTDQIVLHDCDLKCFYVPWDTEFWGEIGKSHLVKVATVYGSIVGFVVARYAEEFQELIVPKLCVKEEFRRRSVGTQLMNEIENFGLQVNAHLITCLVPESFTQGECSTVGWFKALDFRAEGLFHEGAHRAGIIEDIIIFKRGINRGTNE